MLDIHEYFKNVCCSGIKKKKIPLVFVILNPYLAQRGGQTSERTLVLAHLDLNSQSTTHYLGDPGHDVF